MTTVLRALTPLQTHDGPRHAHKSVTVEDQAATLAWAEQEGWLNERSLPASYGQYNAVILVGKQHTPYMARLEEVPATKFNQNHDDHGRFSSDGGSFGPKNDIVSGTAEERARANNRMEPSPPRQELADHLQGKMREHVTAMTNATSKGGKDIRSTLSYHAGARDAYQHSLTTLYAAPVSLAIGHVADEATSKASDHAAIAARGDGPKTSAQMDMGYDSNYYKGSSDAYAHVRDRARSTRLLG